MAFCKIPGDIFAVCPFGQKAVTGFGNAVRKVIGRNAIGNDILIIFVQQLFKGILGKAIRIRKKLKLKDPHEFNHAGGCVRGNAFARAVCYAAFPMEGRNTIDEVEFLPQTQDMTKIVAVLTQTNIGNLKPAEKLEDPPLKCGTGGNGKKNSGRS